MKYIKTVIDSMIYGERKDDNNVIITVTTKKTRKNKKAILNVTYGNKVTLVSSDYSSSKTDEMIRCVNTVLDDIHKLFD